MAVSLVAKYIYKSGYAWKDSLNNFSMRRYFVQYTLPVKLLSAIFEDWLNPYGKKNPYILYKWLLLSCYFFLKAWRDC